MRHPKDKEIWTRSTGTHNLTSSLSTRVPSAPRGSSRPRMDPSSVFRRWGWLVFSSNMWSLMAPGLEQGAPHVILNMCYNKDVIEAQVVSKVYSAFPFLLWGCHNL